nr:hypothetical protein BaRGS_019869 [Batillaria attramentaria]
MSAKVLVTGASGYIASHVVKLLQEAGHQVRGTVRSVKNTDKVKHLYNLCPNAAHKLELVEADLMDAESWPHPFPLAQPKHEDDLIKPAVEGTSERAPRMRQAAQHQTGRSHQLPGCNGM